VQWLHTAASTMMYGAKKVTQHRHDIRKRRMRSVPSHFLGCCDRARMKAGHMPLVPLTKHICYRHYMHLHACSCCDRSLHTLMRPPC
jgi:hypothetical protein